MEPFCLIDKTWLHGPSPLHQPPIRATGHSTHWISLLCKRWKRKGLAKPRTTHWPKKYAPPWQRPTGYSGIRTPSFKIDAIGFWHHRSLQTKTMVDLSCSWQCNGIALNGPRLQPVPQTPLRESSLTRTPNNELGFKPRTNFKLYILHKGWTFTVSSFRCKIELRERWFDIKPQVSFDACQSSLSIDGHRCAALLNIFLRRCIYLFTHILFLIYIISQCS